MLGKAHFAVLALLAISPAGYAVAAELAPYVQPPQDGRPATSAGLRLNDGALSIRADVAVKSDSAATKALPQISSRLALAEGIGLVNQVKLSDWNDGIGWSGAAFDTRLRLQPETALISQIEGRVQQGADGAELHSIKLGFADALARFGTPHSLALSGDAILEETRRPDGENTTALGIQAVMTGLPTPVLGVPLLERADASSTLSVGMRRESGPGMDGNQIATVSYDHAWSFHKTTQVGLKLEASRTEDCIEPALGISWQASF